MMSMFSQVLDSLYSALHSALFVSDWTIVSQYGTIVVVFGAALFSWGLYLEARK